MQLTHYNMMVEILSPADIYFDTPLFASIYNKKGIIFLYKYNKYI